jgi:isopenicillin-N epimerase
VALDAARDARAHLWQLDPRIAFLNHGSFGACPREVLLAQQSMRDRMEHEPVQFFARDLEPLLDSARSALASFIGADPEGLAFVPNATAGVNAVLRSLHFQVGDELLTTNHAYNACRNSLQFAAAYANARVIVAEVPFPIRTADEALDCVVAKASPRTRLALLDHVTSPTALILPIAKLVSALGERGVETLVDGAHAPGMLPLDVQSVGASYYAGNCHKWVCAPKGAGFLYVREDRRADVHPLSISHGMNSRRKDRSRFRLEFDWTGTDDPSPYLCVPEAIRFMGNLLPEGWDALMRHNHQLAIAGRNILCEALGISPPAPDHMLGSMAALPITDGSADPPTSSLYADPQQIQLLEQFGVEVPLVPWPDPPKRVVRISAQIYNQRSEYERLALGLREMLRPKSAAQ